MSQSSDIFLSSGYNAPPSDFLEYVANSTPQLFSPVPSGSQQTLHEPLKAPECLTRVCPDRIRTYILYSLEMSDEFVTWWLQTDFGRKKRMTWDGKRAKCWEYFDQVALDRNGKPGVMCQQCQKVLDHPGWAHSGTTSMNKHYNGVTCRKAALAKGQKPNIKLALEHSVRLGPYYRLYYTNSSTSRLRMRLYEDSIHIFGSRNLRNFLLCHIFHSFSLNTLSSVILSLTPGLRHQCQISRPLRLCAGRFES